MIFRIVSFSTADGWPFSGGEMVTLLGQRETDQYEKLALLETEDVTTLPAKVALVDVFPRGYLSCIGTSGGKYLTKGAVIDWRYPIDHQIRMLRKRDEQFTEFNAFCESIP